jgi:hypothetical protein
MNNQKVLKRETWGTVILDRLVFIMLKKLRTNKQACLQLPVHVSDNLNVSTTLVLKIGTTTSFTSLDDKQKIKVF